MRSIGLLVSRLILGAYLAVHGAQKLFGSFGGHGLDATGARFEHLGMTPGKVMAGVAGASELAGGVLTATGVAYPLGPLAIAGTMVVASTTHRQNGALAANGGFELPLTNFAVAVQDTYGNTVTSGTGSTGTTGTTGSTGSATSGSTTASTTRHSTSPTRCVG